MVPISKKPNPRATLKEQIGRIIPGTSLVWGDNIVYVRKTSGDGFRVRNSVEVWYNYGDSVTSSTKTESIAAYGQRDLTTDLYTVTDSSAVVRYRDNLLEDFSQPVEHATIAYKDASTGNKYDVGDYVPVSVPDLEMSGLYRIYGLTKVFDEVGERTVLDVARDVKVWDTRKYQSTAASDMISELKQQVRELGRY